MEFRKVLVLRGPNVWASFPVLEAWVDLREWKDTSSDMIPGFNERLMNWLPTLIDHRCSVGERGGFCERLQRGTYLAHVLEHATLELQSLAGTEVGFGRTRETSAKGVYLVAVEYDDETLARAALDTAHQLLMAAVHGADFDVAAAVSRLRELAQHVYLGPSTRAVVDAARRRRIPFRRLNSGSLVQFGWGRKLRRIMAAETDRTGAIAQEIAQDKDLTRRLLREIGVPVPNGWPVASAEEAWAAAEQIGLPVVVKPQDGNQGRGVSTNLRFKDQVVHAYAAARDVSSEVLVEQFVPGSDYRLLVVGDRMVAAARREAAHVVGDGTHTISQLIELVNADPRRGDGHGGVLTRIKLDDVAPAVLARQGCDVDSVPPAGQVVWIRRNANLSTGGTATDVTDSVHPDVAARAVEAARVVGLDIAGVDVIADNIGRPLDPQGGAIVELNAAPGLRMHLSPSFGTGRPVGEAIADLLYPPGETGRIPIVAVTGVNGKTTVTRLVAHIVKGTGQSVGMTCTDGIYVGERRIDTDDCGGPRSARAVLANPAVELAVFETARGGILREGLGFDRCDVAVVTNIGAGDHLGLHDIDTPEKLAAVKRVIVEAVAPTGTTVLNAADPLVARMAGKSRGTVLYFAMDPDHPVILQHRMSGGRAAFVRDRVVILSCGTEEIRLIALDRIPLTHGGRIRFQVENVLAAAGAAWALGVPVELITSRVETFAPDFQQSPCRFNVLSVNGATVVVDYGHNVSSLIALVDAVSRFPHERRCIVYTTPGDRRDDDIILQGEILGTSFDRVIIYDGHYTRGRADGETVSLLRRGLAAGIRARDILEVNGTLNAMQTGLDGLRPGDLLVIQAEQIDETVQFLRDFLQRLPAPVTRPADSGATVPPCEPAMSV